MSSALFGNAARASSKNLVEFRAGRMHLKGKVVHPDKRKGLVYIYQSDDSLMHFCWKDRTTGSVEEDLIIFPDDCEYRRLTVCTTGRVYVLRFRSTTRRLFFWMQEPKTEKDDDHCRKVNDLLNNPPTAGSHSTPSRSGGGVSSSGGGSGSSSAGGGVLGGDLSNLRDSDLHNIIGNISQQQLMQILGSGVPNLSSLLGPNSGSSSGRSYSSSSSSSSAVTPTTTSTPTAASTPPPSTPAVTAMETSPSTGTSTSTSATASSGGTAKSSGSGSKAGPIQLADLQNILSGMMGQEGDAGAAGPGVDLSSALTAEALQPILSNPEFVDQLRPLLPSTADPLPPAEQLRGTVTSPQFKQAVSIFSHALQSGQLGPLINQFGLGEDAVLAAASADMEAFVKALGKSPKIASGSDAAAKKDSKDAKKDDDDNMAVD